MVIFKELEQYSGYLFSDDGNIYSYWTSWGLRKWGKPKKIKQALQKRSKYLYVTLRIDKNEYKTKRVHTLICEAFHGPCPENFECSHLDGNRLNCKQENLIWESRKENHKRKILHGTDDCGVRNSRAKINSNQLEEIRELLEKGSFTHKEIGEMYDVGRVFITKIKNKYRYKRN